MMLCGHRHIVGRNCKQTAALCACGKHSPRQHDKAAFLPDALLVGCHMPPERNPVEAKVP